MALPNLELSVLFDDPKLGDKLYSSEIDLPGADISMDAPTRVPGAMGGWFEIVVNLGVLAFPVSVFASCIANWLTAAFDEATAGGNKHQSAKLVMVIKGKSVEITVTNADGRDLPRIIQSALKNIYKQ